MCDTEQQLVIVTHIWQKLSSVEHKKMRIVKITGSFFHTYLAKPNSPDSNRID